MAKGISIQVEGLDKLIKKFGKLPKNVEQEVDGELEALSYGFVDRAQNAAPVDKGFLKGGISNKKVALMNHEVTSRMPYSAYVEFGTITRVDVPAGLEQYAMQFKGAGIKKTGGMHARPFFFAQVPWAQAEINKNLKEVIKRALEK